MTARQCWVLVATAATVLTGAAAVAPAAQAAKVKPPAKVAKARVTSASANGVVLNWKNPKSKKFRATVVRVAKGTKAPKSVKAGRAVGTVSKKRHGVALTRLAAGTVYTVSLFSSDGKKHYSKRVAVRIQTAPAAVTAVKAVSTSSSITLGYRFSASRSATAVVVRYAEGTKAPAYPTSGTAASAGHTGATVRGLFEQTRYSFSVWARDAAKRYSPVAHITTGTKAGPTGNSGAVSGTVYGGSTRTKLKDADVYAYNVNDSDDQDGYGASTSADGTYRLYDLPAGRYNVCFDSDMTSSSAKAGYASGCLAGPVTIVAGRTTGSHDYTLGYAAGFTGTLTGAASTDVLSGVSVYGFAEDDDFGSGVSISSGDDTGSTSNRSGVYTVTGLTPGVPLVLCFSAQDAEGQSVTGYQDDCLDGIVGQAGKIASKNFSLKPAAGISGTVSGHTAANDQPLAGVAVVAVAPGDEDEDNGDLRYAYTGKDGSYVVPGLIPGTDYYVCYDASGVDAVDSQIRDGFVGACETASGLAAWNGDPDDLPTNVVAVRATDTTAPTAHPAVVLDAGGAIGGQVHGDNDRSVRADILVYDESGNIVGGDQVGNGDTTFRATGLPAGKYHVCVYSEDSSYGSECYDDKAWNAGDDGPDAPLPAGLDSVTVDSGQPTTLTDEIALNRV